MSLFFPNQPTLITPLNQAHVAITLGVGSECRGSNVEEEVQTATEVASGVPQGLLVELVKVVLIAPGTL